MSAETPNFERQFSDEDKTRAAMGINEDLMRGIESGEIRVGDDRHIRSADAIEELMGACDYPKYCKFYGERPSFCDRSCGESIWDQI